MDFPKEFEYKPFEFFDKDLQIGLCYELAYDKLEKMYPNYTLFASDCFGISIVDNNNDDCVEVTSFSTGRLGKIGPLAMRDEKTKIIFPLFQNKNISYVQS
ncbi:MAG: hypothetical protein J5588_03150 [Bacteroidales bacterium]|nr:hypothetical protein [Bacteroidales bacterium]